MKTKTYPDFMSTGIMWNSMAFQPYRHFTKQDELNTMTWLKHDGKNFGIQKLVDSQYDIKLTTSFILPKYISLESSQISLESTTIPTWIQRFNMSEYSFEGSDNEKRLLFYFGIDCDGTLSSTTCLSNPKFKSFKVINLIRN